MFEDMSNHRIQSMKRGLIVLAIVSTAAGAQKPDTTATKAAVLAADRALAEKVGREGAGAFVDALDEHAAVLFPGQPILKGAKAARAAFLARYAAPSSYAWNPITAVAGNDGRFACTMGFSHFTSALDSARTTHAGTYITCWHKDDGKWKVVGTQRADSPPKAPALVENTTLPNSPHSATVASGKAQLRGAQDADSMFAMMGALPAGPGPAFTTYAAEDAFVLGGGGDEFPRGRDQITAAFDGFPPTRIISWMPMRDVGYGSGGLAFTVGHASSGPRAGSTGPTNYNKYMTVWRQEPDGRWLYIFDLGTSRPAP
jgi:ketosteroid isomerase-like protein